jgi:predicted RNA polymerase sigma factor
VGRARCDPRIHLRNRKDQLIPLACGAAVQDCIPYETPAPRDVAARLATVLHVIYLVFNEGYSASSGQTLGRPDLTAEAIRLDRLLCALTPERRGPGAAGADAAAGLPARRADVD